VGQLFGQPGKRHWTPMEMVQKSAKLPGVSGALVALQDGLMVASELPPDLNGEMIAAFLPQMFGRVSHYTKQLGLGEPSSLSLVAKQVPLRIIRAGTVYFLAFGRPNESLPDAALGVVAAHLERQSNVP
jgi:predicted regulator of Ras-like GTPase activity (Roadblock/LC7/MglB family)